MGIASNIISVIVKSVVNSKLGDGLDSELIGISIDEYSAKGIDRIKDFINGEKSKIEHILSRENMKVMDVAEENIDFVVAELKDLLSKIEITDELFRECKYNYGNLKDFLWNEYRRDKDIIENESDIKKGLYTVAKTLIELMRESEEFENDLLIQISNSVDDANVELQKISDYMYKNYGSMNEEIQMILVIVQKILEQIQNKDSKENDIEREEKFKNNKKHDYIKNWNGRLFLHLDNEERPVTLADAFIMPDFKMHESIKRIGFSDDDTLEQILEKFIQYTRTSTMLITGVPGMGKTTITSWLANNYETDDNVIILRFRDWERKELKQGLLKAIYEKLECKKKDLENRVLILDGFDEIKALDIRNSVLSEFVSELKDFENFKCIITSRPAYIDAHYFQNIIKLHEFDIDKIERFYKKVTGKVLHNKGKIESNLEVLGIPVILYMAIMSDIDISENPTKPELYSRIFAEKGGIFDKFFDGETQYGSGEQILRKPENIRKYLDFLSDTAFKMFEKGKLQLEKNECKDIKLEFKKKEVSVLEFPIKHLFEDAETNIEFVHKSIYEYFVSEYICISMNNKINNEESVKCLANDLGCILKSRCLSSEILEFLAYSVKYSRLNRKYDVIYMAFQKMLQNGMLYYIDQKCQNILKCEMNIFKNMLEILHCWESCVLCSDVLVSYINHCNVRGINLKGADFSGSPGEIVRINGYSIERTCEGFVTPSLVEANLVEANLRRTNLEGANLIGADLRDADLTGTNLSSANLRDADLRDVDLTDVRLMDAILKGMLITDKQADYLGKRYNLEGVNVYITRSGDVVDYKKYCYDVV